MPTENDARRSPVTRRLALVGPAVLVLLVANCADPARDRQNDSGAARGMVERVYDVRHLIIHVPDFTNAPDFGLGEPGFARGESKDAPAADSTEGLAPAGEEDPEPSRQEIVESVLNLIKQTIAPDGWREAGGAGQIREANGQLVVTNTPANHQAITRLLDDLRAAQAVQASIECRILTVDKETARAFTEAGPKAKIDVAGAATEPPAGGGTDGVFLDDRRVAELLRAVQASRTSTVVTAPRVTLFSGQRAYVMVANQRAYVAGLTMIAPKAPDSKAAFDPEIGIAESGVVLDCQATVRADRRSVVVAINPQVSELHSIEAVPWDVAPAGAAKAGEPAPQVQRPRMRLLRLSMTADIPDGRTLLVAGLGPLDANAELKGPDRDAALPPEPGGRGGAAQPTKPEADVEIKLEVDAEPEEAHGKGAAGKPAAPQVPFLDKLQGRGADDPADGQVMLILIRPTILGRW